MSVLQILLQACLLLEFFFSFLYQYLCACVSVGDGFRLLNHLPKLGYILRIILDC